MQATIFFKTFDGRDFLSRSRADGRDAGAAGTSVEKDRAGAALPLAAAVFAAGQVKLVAQDK